MLKATKHKQKDFYLLLYYVGSAARIADIQRVEGNCSHIVSAAIAIGTPKKAPRAPHMNVQKTVTKITTEGAIDSVDPDITGSK